MEESDKTRGKGIEQLIENGQNIVDTPRGLYAIVKTCSSGIGIMVSMLEIGKKTNLKLFQVYKDGNGGIDSIDAFGDYAWLKPYLKEFLQKTQII